MKKFKILIVLIAALAGLIAFAACTRVGDDDNGDGQGRTTTAPPIDDPVTPPEEIAGDDDRLERHGLELVTIDGEEVLRFIETQPLTISSWNRAGTERNPSISDSEWGDWIRAELLRVHNIAVEIIEIPRFEPPEEQTLAAFLAANTAPDVSYTFSMSTIENFADMGGVHDLAPIINEYMDFIPNLYRLFGADMMVWNRNAETGQNWALTGPHFASDLRISTFVREDWLNTLNIAPPTTLDEFEAMLEAFRDNAELLLGDDAHQMIPYRLTEDVGWTGDPVITAFIPSTMTDRDWYVYGFDDRRFTQPGIREGVRVLNRWYNNDLIWRDFPLHTGGDPMGDNLIMLGFVGAFSANWDYPFRPNPGIITNMQDNVGPEANFIVVTPFQNDAGEVRKFVPQGTDRHIFFPRTNDNIAASLLYLDWLSRSSTREFLMFGPEGVTHERLENGAFRVFSEDEIQDDRWVQQVLRNYDLLFIMGHTITLDDMEAAALSLAVGFPGIEGWRVVQSYEANRHNAFRFGHAQIPTPEAQTQFGSPGLNNQARTVLNQSVTASIADFESVFDAGMAAYLAMGGQAIIDGRRAAWLEVYGDVDWVPSN